MRSCDNCAKSGDCRKYSTGMARKFKTLSLYDRIVGIRLFKIKLARGCSSYEASPG